MNIKKSTQITLGLILGLAASVSYALPITFDFRGQPYSEAPSMVFTQDGITLTVEAFRQNGDQETVTQNRNGLGVCTDPAETNCPGNNQESQIDSTGPNEELLFTISGLNPGQGLALDRFFFEAYSINANQDRFRLFIDEMQVQIGTIKPSGTYTTGMYGGNALDWGIADDFGLLVAHDSFRIRAVEVNGVNAGFRIASFTGHTVPEPTSLALLGLGLVGMGFARRAKKV